MATARMTYVFGDLLTGRPIEEISLSGVSMSRGFGQGEFRGSFQLDQTGKSNRDLLEASQEGRNYIIAERNGTVVWGGYVWSRTYQSQAKIYELYCRAWEHYPEARFVLNDFTYSGIEQRNIFIDLWNQMMSDPHSLLVTMPSSFPNALLKDIEVKEFEFKTYRQVMDEVSAGYDGFDWTIDTDRVGGAYTRTMRIGYPQLGAVDPLIFDYPGQITNYWMNGSMVQHGTHIFGIGAGEGSTALQQLVYHADLLNGGFPRFDISVMLKDITSPSVLSTLTQQAAIIQKAGRPTITAEIKGDLAPEFGSYGLGDACRIDFNDPAHPDPATRSFSSRILGWEYYPPQDETVENVRLVFEGGDLN